MKKKLFCPKCGELLTFTNVSDVKLGVCSCGFIGEVDEDFVISEKPIKVTEGKGILVPDQDKDGFPHTCDKCGYGKADVVDLGASYSDESNVYLFKCKKCGYVSRDAYGSSNS